MGVRLNGMCIGPANSPSVSGWIGGREVVDPISVSGVSVSLDKISVKRLWHIFPWHGPIVTVLYRLSIWTSRKPSSTPCTTSLASTSSQ